MIWNSWGRQREINQYSIFSIFHTHTYIPVTVPILLVEVSPGQFQGSRDSERDFLFSISLIPFHSEPFFYV